jgi:hypothetical protein
MKRSSEMAKKYDVPEGMEKCGLSECQRKVMAVRNSIRYDGYLFCCTEHLNKYSADDGLFFTGTSGAMFFADRPNRQGHRI